MNRTVIVGCGGSGKTHLAHQLAERFDLPLTHLDAVYYDADWNPLPAEDFVAVQQALVAPPRWIIEGNYAATMPIRLRAADTVILLDLPATTCLLGILQRQLRHGRGQHRATGVYNRINSAFIRYVISYRRTMLPRVHQLIAEHGSTAQLVVLRNRRAVQRYVADLSTAP